MMYYIITITNAYLGVIAIGYLYFIASCYSLSKWIEFYLISTMAAMIYMIFVNIYNLDGEQRNWKLPVTSLLWASKTIYFCWAVKFSLHKKNCSFLKPDKHKEHGKCNCGRESC